MWLAGHAAARSLDLLLEEGVSGSGRSTLSVPPLFISIFICNSCLSPIHTLERSSCCPQWGEELRLEIEKLPLKYCHFDSVIHFPEARQPDMQVFGSGGHNPTSEELRVHRSASRSLSETWFSLKYIVS